MIETVPAPLVEFVRHVATSRVHVAVPEEWREQWWARTRRTHPVYDELFPLDDVRAWSLLAPTPMLCGHMAMNPGMSSLDQWCEAFDDERLCGSCRRVWISRKQDPGALFEHPQEDE